MVDASTPNRQEQIHEVNSVLREIDADKIPQIMVYNKIDKLPAVEAHADVNVLGAKTAVWISAAMNDGVNLLLEKLSIHCHGENTRAKIVLMPKDAKLRAQLFEVAQILKEENSDDGCWVIDLNIPDKHKHLLNGFNKFF